MFNHSKHGVPSSRIDLLRGVPMFAGLTDDEVGHIDSHLSERTVRADKTLMTEGEPGREAFVIADGVAAIYVNGVLIGSVGSGDLVGELALLDNGPRTATVVSLTPMRIYVLDPSEFASLFNQPEAGRWIASYLAHRLRVGGSSGTTRAIGVSIPVR